MHFLDNQIMPKKDLRFTRQDQAEDFATTEYKMYCVPQAAYLESSGLFYVRELPNGIKPNDPSDLVSNEDSRVFFIDSLSGEG